MARCIGGVLTGLYLPWRDMAVTSTILPVPCEGSDAHDARDKDKIGSPRPAEILREGGGKAVMTLHQKRCSTRVTKEPCCAQHKSQQCVTLVCVPEVSIAWETPSFCIFPFEVSSECHRSFGFLCRFVLLLMVETFAPTRSSIGPPQHTGPTASIGGGV